MAMRESSRLLILSAAILSLTACVDPLLQASMLGRADSVSALLAQGGADPMKLATALELAAAHGHADAVRAFLDHGADANAIGADGQTALALARAAGHAQVVAILQKTALAP